MNSEVNEKHHELHPSILRGFATCSIFSKEATGSMNMVLRVKCLSEISQAAHTGVSRGNKAPEGSYTQKVQENIENSLLITESRAFRTKTQLIADVYPFIEEKTFYCLQGKERNLLSAEQR